MSHSESKENTGAKLEFPATLRDQLRRFRRELWRIKLLEGWGMGLVVAIISYLGLWLSDRIIDTPSWGRWLAFSGIGVGLAILSGYVFRWVISCRTGDQLARLIGRRFASLGDQIRGAIELVDHPEESGRSRALSAAAVEQVASESAKRDFREAIPRPRHRFWWSTVAGCGAIVGIAGFLAPGASLSAAKRFAFPWEACERFTFAQLGRLPSQIVVPHGEGYTLEVSLAENSPWKPASAQVRSKGDEAKRATLGEGRYLFSLPGRVVPGKLRLSVGDAYASIDVEPMHRPEIETITAKVQLPKYLERPEPIERDLRSGSASVVKGSSVSVEAKGTRRLKAMWFDEIEVTTASETFLGGHDELESTKTTSIRWKDEFGLAGAKPFEIRWEVVDDAAPVVSVSDWPKQRVMINSETLTFTVRAEDDFGVKQVGIEWKGIDRTPGISLSEGSRVFGSGGSEQDRLELAGTFAPSSLRIEPQLLQVRLFAEDYFPDRGRAYSSPFTILVLSPEQHAMWVTEQLNQWHRGALEIRDRERELFQTNNELRQLSDEELSRPETQKRIEKQALAERDNGRRLTHLAGAGEKLLREAMKNPEIGVGHIESWAEMLGILKDIAGKRMPSVAELLKESAQGGLPGEAVAAAPRIGKPAEGGGTGKEESPKPTGPAVPTVVDSEKSTPTPPQGENNEDQEADPNKEGAGNKALRLPATSVMSSGGAKKRTPAGEKMEQAVAEQQNLLAEFEKVADELNKILANLEGSTLVKRLKAAAREQYAIAGKLGEEATDPLAEEKKRGDLTTLSKREEEATKNVSYIMDDLEAYLTRRPFQRFQAVLDEMKKEDVVGSLRRLGEDIKKETSLSIAQGEFWSDTLDRWADNLVDPACNGQCKGQKSKKSLPPSLVLEAMRILEAEMTLREETRVVEQAQSLDGEKAHLERSQQLGKTQRSLDDRVIALAEKIAELPDGESEFAKELKLLEGVDLAMQDADKHLSGGSTGKPAIAAETEAIELLLRSKKINPKKGGGGGDSPGGGGEGTTSDPAIALLGLGVNEKEVRENRPVQQATGESGSKLPEEFKSGLDEYFSRLEDSGGGQ
jgi:hypothetical protein